MRLYLASHNLGDFAEVLGKMVGENRRALVIGNARDYYQDEERIQKNVDETIENLAKVGIKAERLDLRQYFGKQDELEKKVESVGLIFAVGGNVICLATAMHESGMDKIIKTGLAADEFVYGGYSSGSMVAGNDLSLYQLNTKPGEEQPLRRMPDVTRELYGLEPYKKGLGIVAEYVIPHVDRADHVDAMNERTAKIEKAGGKVIRLKDSDVLVMDSSNKLSVLANSV